MQVFAGMDFETGIHSMCVEIVENGRPSSGEFREGFVHQPLGPPRVGVQVWPQKRAGEGRVRGDPQPLGRAHCKTKLLLCPGSARLRIATDMLGREAVHDLVKCGVHGHQLTGDMRGEFGQGQAMIGQHALDLVGIGLALGSLLHVDKARVPSRDLNTFEALLRCPFRE